MVPSYVILLFCGIALVLILFNWASLKDSSRGMKYCFGACLAFGLLCLIATGEYASGFYQFVRLFALFDLGIMIITYSAETETFLNPVTCIAGTMLILFNPIVPIYLDKSTWQSIDIFSGIASFGLGCYILKKNIAGAE